MLSETNRWVLASNNPGKIAEFNALLAPLNITVVPQGELGVAAADETACTFVENALLKARQACQHTGLPALADDSGIAVDALDGAPGIRSARFAGTEASDADNIHKLLTELTDVPDQDRTAAFHCVLVWMRHALDPTPLICHGRWEGRILHAPQGQGGFGYDPVFFAPETQCSAAELQREQKQALSHRGKALRQLMTELGVHKQTS